MREEIKDVVMRNAAACTSSLTREGRQRKEAIIPDSGGAVPTVAPDLTLYPCAIPMSAHGANGRKMLTSAASATNKTLCAIRRTSRHGTKGVSTVGSVSDAPTLHPPTPRGAARRQIVWLLSLHGSQADSKLPPSARIRWLCASPRSLSRVTEFWPSRYKFACCPLK